MRAGDLLAAVLRGDGWPDESAVGESELIQAAIDHCVTPLVYRELQGTRIWDRLTPFARAELTRRARHAVVVDAVMREDLARVTRALEEAGVRPLLFKGAALAMTHYPEPWLRTRGDADVLVREGDAEAACAVLDRFGFERTPRPDGALVVQQARFESVRGGVAVAYDIHWRVTEPHAFADALTYADLDRDARAVALGEGSEVRVVSDVHALAVACVHRAAHHHDTDSLMFLYDIDLLARRFSAEEWQAFAVWAETTRQCAVSLRGLDLAGARLGTATPPPINARLAAAGRTEPTAGYVGRVLKRTDLLLADLQAFTGWRQRAALIRQHLFPSRAYMLASSRNRHLGMLPALYLRRIARGALEWRRSLKEPLI